MNSGNNIHIVSGQSLLYLLQDENGDYIVDENGDYIMEKFASVRSVEKLQNQINELTKIINELLVVINSVH